MIASTLFLLAALFYFVAGLGLLRLPDSLSRLHAGTKASSLATVLALAAAVTYHASIWSAVICGASLLFVFLTAPLASHAIGRCILHARLHEQRGAKDRLSNLPQTSATPPITLVGCADDSQSG